MRVKFTVIGVPVAKQRPKFASRGRFVQAYTPDKTINYENLVKLSYTGEKLQGTIRATIFLFFPIPKSTSKKKTELMKNLKIMHTKKPDADNCIKSILDALNGIAFDDDGQVAEIHTWKYYSENPRAEVVLEEITEEE